MVAPLIFRCLGTFPLPFVISESAYMKESVSVKPFVDH
jgi:hypothetical protein